MKTVLYKNKSIEPRKSEVHGWGIFTKEKISKGEILEECHCLYMTEDEASYTHHLKPIKRNIKPKMNAPETGSSLKKLITRSPFGWITPSISIFPYPSILLPLNLSK